MVSFVLDHLSLYVIGKEKDFNKAFTDVKAGDWFYGDVQYVYEKGLMKGTGAASFSPGIKTTRGMIVTIRSEEHV